MKLVHETINDVSIPRLYYRYKRTEDNDLRELLERISIVHLTHKGPGTIVGYYPLADECMNSIKEKLRTVSLTFDNSETKNEPITGLKPYKEFAYLVKSSSRFFLKPDFGEMIDAMEFEDRIDTRIVAIQFSADEYYTLPGTDGEHFIMKAVLLIKE
jgi:hypothetical protein